MLAYNLLLLLILILGICLCEIKKSKLSNVIFLSVVSVVMAAMSFLRAHTVGIDFDQYAVYYDQVRKGGWQFLISSRNGYRIEPGYSLLNYAVSRFTGNIHIFMLVVSVIVIGLTAVLLYKYSPIPWIGMFVFVSFGFFGNSLSFIRQCIAISIFLFSIEYLKNKKFIPYALIVLLASTFHKSMIVMIPVYFIAHIKINWKSLAVYAVLTGTVMGFSWPLFNFATKYVYKQYNTTGGLYYMFGRDWQTAAVPVITMAIMLILKNFILKRDSRNIVLLNFSIYTGLLYIMTCQHFLFQRLGMMFFTSAILLVPELLASVGVDSKQEEALDSFKNLKGYKDKGKKKAAIKERRKIKNEVNEHRSIYYYSIAALVFIGFIYQVWILLQNRINLIPYITFL